MAGQNTIKCGKCGAIKGTTTKRLNDLIKKYGSVKKLNDSYLCRDCKRSKASKALAATAVNGKIPLPLNKIECTKCKQIKGSTPDRTNKLASEFGGIDKLRATYVCKRCRTGKAPVIKSGKSGKFAKKTKSKKVKKVKKLKAKKLKSKLTCGKCGDRKATNPAGLNRLVNRFGSLEEAHNKYICQKCRKELNLDKFGRMKPEKRKRKENSIKNYYDKDGNFTLPDSLKIKPKHDLGIRLGEWKTWTAPGVSKKDLTIAASEAIRHIEKHRKVA